MDTLTISVAGITVTIHTDYKEAFLKKSADYVIWQPNANADIDAWATNECLEEIKDDNIVCNDEEREFYAFHAAVVHQLYRFDAILMHGVAIGYNGKSYIFTAPSGVGKSTRANLFRRYIGNDKVSIINGDKPIIRKINGKFYASGTPWCGKESLSQNVMLPVGGIGLLHRSDVNRANRAQANEIVDFIIPHQVYIPKEPEAAAKTLELLDEALQSIPIYNLFSDRSEEGIKVIFECFTGENFEQVKIRSNEN